VSILLEHEGLREIFLSLSRVITSNLNNKIRVIRLLIGKRKVFNAEVHKKNEYIINTITSF
jgi:hypothetical protein